MFNSSISFLISMPYPYCATSIRNTCINPGSIQMISVVTLYIFLPLWQWFFLFEEEHFRENQTPSYLERI